MGGRGQLISRWAYIWNNIFIGKWMGLYPGGLKTGGGGFKVGFYGIYLHVTSASRVSISVCSFIIIF